MPLLVRGLDLSDVDIRSTIFKTLLAVAENDAKSSTQEHATTLVTIALKNTLPQDYTSPVGIILVLVTLLLIHIYQAEFKNYGSEIFDSTS